MWPTDPDSLKAEQRRLAELTPLPWRPRADALSVGGCWVSFARGLTGPGRAGDPAWAAAAVMTAGRLVAQRVQVDLADAAYLPALLALRVGRPAASVVEALSTRPDVLLLDATGRDHPRRAGLALHLGHLLDLPTVGVTHRPLIADGAWPEDRSGATSPLLLGGEVVGCWLRTVAGSRPLAVHPGWRVDVATAAEVVTSVSVHRTPEPLRQARRLAREARARTTGA